MRKQLVEQLRCPITKQSLLLNITSENEQEVREGTLVNTSGEYTYPIIDGVVELFPVAQLDRETQTEREARNVKRRDWSIEQQRPYLNDNNAAPWIWPAFTANVEQGLAQIYLKGKFVLDIGCATAWSTRMICERGAQAVALDISTGILRDAEAQFATGVYFDRIAATMTSIPFEDSTFDVVFTSAALHHSSDLSTALREFARVLKPGGAGIIVNEPVHGLLKSADTFGQEEIEAGMNEHIHRLWDYQQAARKTGFRTRLLFPADLEKQMKGINPIPPSPMLNTLRRAWSIAAPFKSGLLYIGHWLVGLTMVMVVVKQEASSLA